jgi:hypothetical protein
VSHCSPSLVTVPLIIDSPILLCVSVPQGISLFKMTPEMLYQGIWGQPKNLHVCQAYQGDSDIGDS